MIYHKTVAKSPEADVAADLRESQRISLEDWKRCPITERAAEPVGWVIGRQP